MPIFDQGTTIRLPFPYTARSTYQRRPALVVSSRQLGISEALLWVVMVTSAENRAWPGDLSLGARFLDAGLPAPSIIRPCKIATIEARYAEPLGRIDPDLLGAVMSAVGAWLGFRPSHATAPV